jgi:hypothetical protein
MNNNFPIETLSETEVAELAGITVKELRYLVSIGKGPPGEMDCDDSGNPIRFIGNPEEQN